MGTDFDSLVLAPNMSIFGKTLDFTPEVSQPLSGDFQVTGIFTVRTFEIPTDGGVFPVVSLNLGLQLSQFVNLAGYTVMPLQGDRVTVSGADLPLGYWQGSIVPPGTIDFLIDSILADGQGGATAKLKRVTA